MKNAHKFLAVVAALGFCVAAHAEQQEIRINPNTKTVPYAIDQRSVVVRSATGLCWRTGFWTKELAASTPVEGSNLPAGCFCDKDLMPKEVCEPPVAPAAEAPAAEAPKPAVSAVKPAAEKVTIAADALFDFDKATLRPEGKAKLDEVAAKAKAIKLEVIIAVGHTDRFGSDAYNQKLSEKRAAAVKTYLVSKGIDANRVYTEGKGKKNPVTKPDQCPGKAPTKKVIECLQPDRRVDIELIGTK